jgi:hypothetical protein
MQNRFALESNICRRKSAEQLSATTTTRKEGCRMKVSQFFFTLPSRTSGRRIAAHYRKMYWARVALVGSFSELWPQQFDRGNTLGGAFALVIK